MYDYWNLFFYQYVKKVLDKFKREYRGVFPEKLMDGFSMEDLTMHLGRKAFLSKILSNNNMSSTQNNQNNQNNANDINMMQGHIFSGSNLNSNNQNLNLINVNQRNPQPNSTSKNVLPPSNNINLQQLNSVQSMNHINQMNNLQLQTPLAAIPSLTKVSNVGYNFNCNLNGQNNTSYISPFNQIKSSNNLVNNLHNVYSEMSVSNFGLIKNMPPSNEFINIHPVASLNSINDAYGINNGFIMNANSVNSLIDKATLMNGQGINMGSNYIPNFNFDKNDNKTLNVLSNQNSSSEDDNYIQDIKDEISSLEENNSENSILKKREKKVVKKIVKTEKAPRFNLSKKNYINQKIKGMLNSANAVAKNNRKKRFLKNNKLVFIQKENNKEENEQNKASDRETNNQEEEKGNLEQEMRLNLVEEELAKERKPRGSRYRGVSRNGSQWQVLIMVNKKKRYVGSYSDEKEAARAYDKVALQNHGQKAKTNFDYNKEELKCIINAPPLLKV